MLRFLLPLVLCSLAAFQLAASNTSRDSSLPATPEPPASSPSPGGTTILDQLEDRFSKLPPGPDRLPHLEAITGDVFRLIESSALQNAVDYARAAKLVFPSFEGYRNTRVGYELALTSAALGDTNGQKLVAGKWNELLGSLGRPYRTDENGFVARNPDYFSLDPAPACIQAVLLDPEKANTKAKTASDNAEVQRLVDEDQADRRNAQALSQSELAAMKKRDTLRNERIRQIVSEGSLQTAVDFANAALVMQHSGKFEGYQLAHELAVSAFLLGHKRARWLAAASYDRMLRSMGHDQRFGTQYQTIARVNRLARVDTAAISDAQRFALGCPSLDSAKNRTFGRSGDQKSREQTIAEFMTSVRHLRDPKFGLEVELPEGWSLSAVERWGDRQTTLGFSVAGKNEIRPALYYRIFDDQHPVAPEGLEAYGRASAEKKQAERKELFKDYTNRPESLRTLNVGRNNAVAWIADFTSRDGYKLTELFVRIPGNQSEVLLFITAPQAAIDEVYADAETFMSTVRMPTPPSPSG